MLNIEYDKIYKHPHHNNAGDIVAYAVDKADLDNVLQMLRTAEQERAQYKNLAEQRLLQAEQMAKMYDEKAAKLKSKLEEATRALNGEIILCDSLRSQLQEAAQLMGEMQVSEHQKHLELESLRAKIKEAQEQEPVYFWREIGVTDWMECNKTWYLKCLDSPEHDTKILYAAAPVIPD